MPFENVVTWSGLSIFFVDFRWLMNWMMFLFIIVLISFFNSLGWPLKLVCDVLSGSMHLQSNHDRRLGFYFCHSLRLLFPKKMHILVAELY